MNIFDQRHRKIKGHMHARLIPVEVKPRDDWKHGVGQAGQYAQQKLLYIARLLPQTEAKRKSVYSVFTDYDNIVIIQSNIVGFERQTPRLKHVRTPLLPFLKTPSDDTPSTAPPTEGFKALHKLLSASTKELGGDLLSHPDGYGEEHIVGIGGSCVVYKVDEEGKEPMVKKVLMLTRMMPLNGVEDEVETLEHLNASLPPEARAHVPTLHRHDYDSLTISPRGTPLIDLLRSSESPGRRMEIARLVVKILPALRHIHKANIAHRDIRPSNIVVARREVPGGGKGDEVREEEVAVLVDWGLATPLRTAKGNWKELAHIGTIDYNVNWGIKTADDAHRYHIPQADIAALWLVVIFILDWKEGDGRPGWFHEWRRQTSQTYRGGEKPRSREEDIHDIRDAYIDGIRGKGEMLATAVDRFRRVQEKAREGKKALEECKLYEALD